MASHVLSLVSSLQPSQPGLRLQWLLSSCLLTAQASTLGLPVEDRLEDLLGEALALAGPQDSRINKGGFGETMQLLNGAITTIMHFINSVSVLARVLLLPVVHTV